MGAYCRVLYITYTDACFFVYRVKVNNKLLPYLSAQSNNAIDNLDGNERNRVIITVSQLRSGKVVLPHSLSKP